MKIRFKKKFLILVLLGSILALSAPFWVGLNVIFGQTLTHIKLISKTSLETRKILFYGNRSKIGYGYLRDIVAHISNSNIFPLTRYKNYGQNAHLLFPGRRETIDSRILVGIDLSDTDITPGIIAAAKKIHETDNPLATTSIWAFVTVDDFDSLTGFQLRFSEGSSGLIHIRANLIDSPTNQRELGAWTWTVEAKSLVKIDLPTSVEHLSFSRGSEPFLVGIEITFPNEQNKPKLEDLEPVGIKVDLRNYVVINKDQTCFTALRRDFLSDIVRLRPVEWIQFIERVKNV